MKERLKAQKEFSEHLKLRSKVTPLYQKLREDHEKREESYYNQ